MAQMQKEILASFRKKIQEDITPLDVVASILYFFGDDAKFTTNYEKLHQAFFRMKENLLLKEFQFREGGPYPYSELLENVFSRLAISGLLGCQNPDYRQFTINKGQRGRIEAGSLKKFSGEQIRELKSISREIQENLQ